MTALAHFLTSKEMIGGAIETVPYTAETLNSSHYDNLFRNLKISPEIDSFIRKYAVGDYDAFTRVQGCRMAEFSFTHDLQGSGTSTTPPRIGRYYKACAMRETIGGSGVLYIKDANKNSVPMTIEFVLKGTGDSPTGVKVKLKGCMGDVEFVMTKVGEPLQANFRFMGGIVSITSLTAAQLPGATGWDTTEPPNTLSATFKLRGYLMSPNSFAVKSGNKLEMLKDMTQVDGYEGCYVVDADPTFTLDPYLAHSSDQMFWEIATGETGPATGVLHMWAGSTAVLGNHIQIRGHQAQVIKSHAIGSREGTEMNPIEGIFTRGTTGAPMLEIIYGSPAGVPGY